MRLAFILGCLVLWSLAGNGALTFAEEDSESADQAVAAYNRALADLSGGRVDDAIEALNKAITEFKAAVAY